VGWVLPLVLECIPDGQVIQAFLPAQQPLVFPPVPVDEGRKTTRTAPAVAETAADTFAMPRRLILEEGPEAT